MRFVEEGGGNRPGPRPRCAPANTKAGAAPQLQSALRFDTRLRLGKEDFLCFFRFLGSLISRAGAYWLCLSLWDRTTRTGEPLVQLSCSALLKAVNSRSKSCSLFVRLLPDSQVLREPLGGVRFVEEGGGAPAGTEAPRRACEPKGGCSAPAATCFSLRHWVGGKADRLSRRRGGGPQRWGASPGRSNSRG